MNDFLMLGISAGVPILVCFLAYVGLSLGIIRSPHSLLTWDGSQIESLRATCRAGAIVLLIGFFFDGGLFKIATGSIFWILLELGRMNASPGSMKTPNGNLPIDWKQTSPMIPAKQRFTRLARWEIWLRRLAWALGITAFAETTILVGTPFLPVNNTTLVIARHYLLPPSSVADLNFLAARVDWSGRKLRPLVQHADLANYNRQLIDWKMDDRIYRECVLNPSINPQYDGQLNWRRKLWEYFYLPVRQENNPRSAAQIVLQHLSKRILLVSDGPLTIEEMWREERSDRNGFEALKVAAFRSVGVPARLDSGGRAQLFADGKWHSPPE